MENIAIGYAAKFAICPDQIIDAIDALYIHRQALKTISNLACHRETLDTAHLLEIRKLRHFHTVEPNLPTKPPRSKRWRLPVVFDKTHIMYQWINTDSA